MGFEHRKTATFWLTQAARAHRVSFGAELSKLGLHAGQELVLKILSDEGPQTMSALAKALGVQPPTATKTVSRLTLQGFVKRRASKEDSRQAYAEITAKGQKLIKKIDKTWKRLERQAFKGFEEKERHTLRKYLKRIEKNIT